MENKLDNNISSQLDAVKNGKQIANQKPKATTKRKAVAESKPKPIKSSKRWETLNLYQLRKYARKIGVRRWKSRGKSGLIMGIKQVERRKGIK